MKMNFYKSDLLIEESKEIETLKGKNKEEVKHYLHNLSQRMQEEEARLMEQKREIDDKIWELRHSESKVFNFYLGI